MAEILRTLVRELPSILDSFSSVVEWCFTPINELAGSVAGDLVLGVFGELTPFALMFSTGLLFYLVYTLVSWVIDILP